ncbi:hypothetical protein E4K72_21160 [Oxalobacteraceae bacterium OM1]|nr:hypothetical protein E4K72_21160 [Oxalobacteraceae bacterium OM1]
MLVVSNVLLAPAIPQEVTGWLLCIGAALSLVYLCSVRGPQRWRENKLPVMDWVWYIALSYLAYALALISGIGVLRSAAWAMPAIGGTMVFMLIIGIRNAWDLAVWLPLQERNPERQPTAAETTAPRQSESARTIER